MEEDTIRAWVNEKGESTINIIIWVAIVSISITILYWYMNTFVFFKDQIEYMQSDLSNLREQIDEACPTKQYRYQFNPRTEKGTLSITNQKLCIKSADQEICQASVCNLQFSATINLESITNISVEKNNHAFNIYGQ